MTTPARRNWGIQVYMGLDHTPRAVIVTLESYTNLVPGTPYAAPPSQRIRLTVAALAALKFLRRIAGLQCNVTL